MFSDVYNLLSEKKIDYGLPERIYERTPNLLRQAWFPKYQQEP